MKKVILFTSLALLFACGSSKILTTTADDAIRLQEEFPNVTASDLEQGKKLFEQYCTICHGAGKSYGVTSAKLQKVVPVMVGKTNKKLRTTAIDKDGSDKILQYLTAVNTQ